MLDRKKGIEEMIQIMHLIKGKLFSHCSVKDSLTRTQWMILKLLKDKKYNLTDLVSELKISASAVTQLVDELVKKKLVIKNIDKDDKRFLILKITPNGDREVLRFKKDNLKLLIDFFEPLTDKEFEKFYELMHKLAKINN